MADRCPASLMIGKGKLDGYRWQINDRGVANIVKSARDFVEGLVYQIDAEDKRQLDRSEGLARGFYDDEQLYIQLLPLLNPGIKTFHLAKQLEMDDKLDPEQRGHQPSRSKSPRTRREAASVTRKVSPPRRPRQRSLEMVEALVYVSHEYKDDGLIRPEYVARMEKAITDGRKMGLSDPYLDHIDRIIHETTPLRQNNDAYRTNCSPQYDMENRRTSHEPYEVLTSTRSRPERYEEVSTDGPSYPSYVNMIIARPRHKNLDGVEDIIRRREIRYVDERPHQPTRDTGRRSEVRDQREDRSPTRSRQSRSGESRQSRSGDSRQSRSRESRQSRSRDKQNDSGWSGLISRYSIARYLPEQFVEFRKRSNSSPY